MILKRNQDASEKGKYLAQFMLQDASGSGATIKCTHEVPGELYAHATHVVTAQMVVSRLNTPAPLLTPICALPRIIDCYPMA